MNWLHSLFTPAPRFRVRYRSGAYSELSTADARELYYHELSPQTRRDVQRMADRHSVSADLFDAAGNVVDSVSPR